VVRRDERDRLLAYRFETLPEQLDAFVSTRHGGVSAPPYDSLNLGLRVGDQDERVVENRQRLFAAFELPLERSVWCKQVHADRVVVVGAADAGRGSTEEETIVEETDALVTDTLDLPLCVTVADCVPVVIFDPQRHVVGLAHAGWGGTVARISSRTVGVMRDQFGSDPASMVAAIGPSIGPAGYEVGEDVIERATESFGAPVSEILTAADGGKALFDLWSANRIDLEEAGLAAERIEVSGIASEGQLEDFYSHRVEGPRTGRFIAVVSLSGTDR
jgi:YfiH family protein